MSENPFDLTGKVAIVTGTSRGLGQYFGRALARAGADLVITSRDPAMLAPFQAEIEALGRRALPLPLEVRSLDSIRTMVEAAVAHYGKIDVLVNNAGCNVRKLALDITWDDWNLVLETNLRGTFFVSQAVARHMIARKYGRIINLGSVTCVFGYAGLGLTLSSPAATRRRWHRSKPRSRLWAAGRCRWRSTCAVPRASRPW